MYCLIIIDHNYLSVHNNFIIGADQKEYRDKEMLFWVYDKNHYYSSQKNKYLMVDIVSNNISQIENYIKFSFELSLKINRILILPSIPCSLCKKRKYFSNKCSFIVYFNIRKLNKYIGKDKYRENVYFLYNSHS